MHGLLSLANTDSHNFTAEVLLRQGTGSWNLPQAQQRAMQWLAAQDLPMQGVVVVDGSGLDRGNKLTTRLLTALLLRMSHHPYASHYAASMAIAGQRGTLRNYWIGSELNGRFRGKTGTISGVRSVSGLLETSEGLLYVSMVSNGAMAPNSTIGEILRQSMVAGLCHKA
jgi:D-alanyl-D-alanine carboxypeptidase/D-alanyl-D-alanine-endopeptidase (penicillin-binding protein 4)